MLQTKIRNKISQNPGRVSVASAGPKFQSRNNRAEPFSCPQNPLKKKVPK